MTHGRTDSSVSSSQASLISVHRTALCDLPKAGEDWLRENQTKAIQELHPRLHLAGLIVKTDRVRKTGTKWYWRTPEYVDAAIDEMCRAHADAADAMLPCGHNQFKTERGTGDIICTFPGCGDPETDHGERHTRAEVEAHQARTAETQTETETESGTSTDEAESHAAPLATGGEQ